MANSKLSRRHLLKSLSAGTFVAVLPGVRRVSMGAASRSMRLGGPVFLDSEDPGELAEAHRNLGYRAAYAPKAEISDSARIRAIRREYGKRDVVLAEVGAWVNMLDPDAAKRKENLAFVAERLALADELGARCCVNISGSFHPEIWYGPHPGNLSPEFFDATVENVRTAIDQVRPKRTRFTIEMMGWALPTTPDEYLDLIRAVDRPEFAVHLDVCNAVNSPQKIYRNTDLINECFDKLSPWIVSCHAKDVAWVPELQVRFQEVIPGRGEINYSAYLKRLAELPTDAPLMLEHLKGAEEYAEGSRYIREVARQLGLSFG